MGSHSIIGEDHLFQYATTSWLKPWRRRVFSFSQTAVVPEELAPWPVNIPPHGVWPEHLLDGPRKEFLKWFLSRQDVSIAQVERSFGLPDDAVGNAEILDRIGDQIIRLIEFSPEAALTRVKQRQKPGQDLPPVFGELVWAPVWNTILLDLAHFVGAGVIQVYAEANPCWTLIDVPGTPDPQARFPLIRMEGAQTVDLQNSEDAVFQKLIQKDPSLRHDPEKWVQIVERELAQRGHSLNEVDLADYRPDRFLQPADATGTFNLFFALMDFFAFALKTRYRIKDPYSFDDGPRALGDILRPGHQPDWIGFPKLAG